MPETPGTMLTVANHRPLKKLGCAAKFRLNRNYAKTKQISFRFECFFKTLFRMQKVKKIKAKRKELAKNCYFNYSSII